MPPFVSHVELSWQVPGIADFNRRLTSFCRLIRFDKRGYRHVGSGQRGTDARDAHGRCAAKAAELGDARWRELLQAHHALIRRLLVRFRGRELDTAGDGFFAAFDGPARAIRCARAICENVRDLRLEVRAGLHAEERELMDGKVGGIAAHFGARVAGEAAPGEVVSGTVKGLVAGSGIEFHERGATELKGVPGEWRLFSVAA